MVTDMLLLFERFVVSRVFPIFLLVALIGLSGSLEEFVEIDHRVGICMF